MKSKYILALLSVYFICCAHMCESEDGGQQVYDDAFFHNSSDETVLIMEMMTQKANPVYPNALSSIRDRLTPIEPQEFIRLKVPVSPGMRDGRDWEILVFKQSTIDRYTDEEIIKKNIFDKLYVFTYEDFVVAYQKITYVGK